MKENNIIVGVGLLIVIVGGILFLISSKSETSSTVGEGAAKNEVQALAQCLTDSGAVFYGAFWCPHCAQQKALFGKSENLLPYVECSTPDGNSQLQICADKQIKSYPTWKFADGTELTGEVSLDTLAQKSGCDTTTGTPPPTKEPEVMSDADLSSTTPL